MESTSNEAAQAITKPGGSKQAAEKLTIPKHRFDCVNLCLKETKQTLREKAAEAERQKARIAELEEALLESKAETMLAIHRAKSLTAAKALIDFSNLKPERDGSMPGLEEEVLRVKESRGYLFEDRENVTYLLVPVRGGNALDKSIADYVNGQKQNAPTGAAEERE
jgi:hypothetical protein